MHRIRICLRACTRDSTRRSIPNPTRATAGALLAAAAVLWADAAHAGPPANLVRLAAARYDTHSSTDGITGAGIPPGADARTGDATTITFAYRRMVGQDWSLELVLGLPPKIHADATGSIAALGRDILSAKAVTPTLLLSYHFGEDGSTLRPYVGAGINYTHFAEVRSRVGGTAHLSDTTGWALQLGLQYAITREWGLFASVVRVDSKTKLTTDGPPSLSSTIDLKPRVYAAGLTYSF